LPTVLARAAGELMTGVEFEQDIGEVRRFNRFYTRRIGVLRESLLDSPFSVTEARVLYEVNERGGVTAADLCRDLGIDAGYLSRILKRFERQGLISRTASERDGRQSHLALTAAGRDAFAPLDRRSRDEVAAMLSRLTGTERRQLMDAMQKLEGLLGAGPGPSRSYRLRAHQPGDMGWIVHRHGALYAQEYGWNKQFEALVARIVAQFLETFDPRGEQCWVAEKDGGVVGSVFLVRQSHETAKLRLLYVEPSARGLGIGGHLVAECIEFAKAAGYRCITLWTNSILHAARHLYERAGFRLIAAEPHHSFGHDLVGETWELELDHTSARTRVPADAF
jgi:DNA-binding MarR family transcriptional regulator/GNAT superfamily N-acetyltransferase